jgi:predicted CoA-binding protein
LPFENPTPDALRIFLGGLKNIAVVGMSLDPDRPSYSVAMYMQSRGCRIIPVRPGGGTVLGEPVHARLADIPSPIDLVDVFRASRFVSGHVDEAIASGAPAIWMQEGVIDEEAALRAQKAGLFVVMNRCLLKEFRKLRGPSSPGVARS